MTKRFPEGLGFREAFDETGKGELTAEVGDYGWNPDKMEFDDIKRRLVLPAGDEEVDCVDCI